MPRTSTCQAAALDKSAPSCDLDLPFDLISLLPSSARTSSRQCSSCNTRHYAAVKNGRQRDCWAQCGRLIGLAAQIRPPAHVSPFPSRRTAEAIGLGSPPTLYPAAMVRCRGQRAGNLRLSLARSGDEAACPLVGRGLSGRGHHFDSGSHSGHFGL